jgi:hypothetical protein
LKTWRERETEREREREREREKETERGKETSFEIKAKIGNMNNNILHQMVINIIIIIINLSFFFCVVGYPSSSYHPQHLGTNVIT